MTRDEIIARNDRLRTELKGGIVLMSPGLMELDARIRGRLLYRLTLYNTFDDDSDHGEGVLIFAGFTILWRIDEFAGELALEITTPEDL